MRINKRAVDALAVPVFRKGSDDHKLLCKMLRDGVIRPGASPKEIHQMSPAFAKYPLDKFRNGLYAAKADTQFNLRREHG